jgi:hypothetical protein
VRFGRRRKAAKRTSGHGSKRRRRLLFLPLAAVALLAIAIVAFAGPVGTGAGFEDDDGNLIPQSPINFDWNNLDPDPTGLATNGGWTGSTPTREATSSVSGWDFNGFEDWGASTADSGFAGPSKTPSVRPSSPRRPTTRPT